MNRTGAQFNRVSGRIEKGSAVTAKVFTLGNSFELSGRDYYEKSIGHKQSIKENRLRQHDERRRAASHRARAEKQRMLQTHKAHLASSRTDRFSYVTAGGNGPPGPAAPRTTTTQTLQQQKQQQQQRTQQKRTQQKRTHQQQKRTQQQRTQQQRNQVRSKVPSRMPSNAPSTRSPRNNSSLPLEQKISAVVGSDEIGIVAQKITNDDHFDTRRAIEQHQSNLSRAKTMQRGGEGSTPEDEGTWWTGRNTHKDRVPKSSRLRDDDESSNSSPPPAYTQAKNTRQPDAYLNILLGKSPPRDEEQKQQGEWANASDEGKHSSSVSPRGSPGTIQKAMALEKELKRRRRLLEIESGLDTTTTHQGMGHQNEGKSASSSRDRKTPRDIVNAASSSNNPAPFDVEPVARRIERRKQMEKQKMMDGNVTRLIRAVKSVVVELQLMIWDWAKSPSFKSKDVARGRRVGLRRKLHRLLDDHRHAVIDLVSAVRNWSSNRGMETFVWNEHDILDLIRRMTTIVGSSSDGARGLMPGTYEAHEAEFGLSFLAEVDGVVDFLGFAIGEGDVVRRIDGAVDCNMMLLTPSDRVRALRLLGDQREADHMAASVMMQLNRDGDDFDDDDDDVETFPYSCPEDMPLACRLCHAGERSDDGKCQNCGHMGGDNWRELDSEARIERYEEEKGWFLEDQEERIRQKAASKEKKNGSKKKPSDIKYAPKISDKDLLKIAKVHRAILAHHLATQEAAGTLYTNTHEEGMYENKMGEENGDDDDILE